MNPDKSNKGEAAADNPTPPEGSAKSGKSGGKKQGKTNKAGKGQSRAKKPNRQKFNFPVSDIHQMLSKGRTLKNVDPQVAVYLTAVEEYVAHEIIELAGNYAINRNSRTLDEKDVVAVIQSDKELFELVGDVINDKK